VAWVKVEGETIVMTQKVIFCDQHFCFYFYCGTLIPCSLYFHIQFGRPGSCILLIHVFNREKCEISYVHKYALKGTVERDGSGRN
jgi:hypothetical protein